MYSHCPENLLVCISAYEFAAYEFKVRKKALLFPF